MQIKGKELDENRVYKVKGTKAIGVIFFAETQAGFSRWFLASNSSHLEASGLYPRNPIAFSKCYALSDTYDRTGRITKVLGEWNFVSKTMTL